MVQSESGPRRPSLSVVRELTDRHVVDQLLTTPELTRAELAARTAISKPTISESVRRLTEAGVLTEAGQQLGRRGPAGTFYRLRSDVGVAVAGSAGPDGVLVEVLDLQGDRLGRSHRPVVVPATRSTLEPLLAEATAEVQRASALLNKPGFADKAPAHVVQGARDKLQAAQERQAKLQARLAEL